MIIILKVLNKRLQFFILFHFSKSKIMKAKDLLIDLVKDSANLEKLGVLNVPEENWHDFLKFMFGEYTRESSGFVRPGKTYLYCFGNELDEYYDVLLRTNEDCIALALVN